MTIPQDLTRPRTVPRRRCASERPRSSMPSLSGIIPLSGRGRENASVERESKQTDSPFAFAQTSSATQMIAISDSCECLRCSRCRCRGFGRETDGRTRIQPVYNTSSTGASCLSSVSHSLSFFPLLLLSFTHFSPFPTGALATRHFHREYPGSAVCTSTPIRGSGETTTTPTPTPSIVHSPQSIRSANQGEERRGEERSRRERERRGGGRMRRESAGA